MTILVWFRRDLRVTDHRALHAALEAGAKVVPVFVISPETIRAGHMGAPIVHFFLESLRALSQNIAHLGGRLIVRTGDFAKVLMNIADESGADALYFNKDYEPDALKRDTEVIRLFRESGREVRRFKDQVCFETHEILTSEGRPYTVFTPYSRKWRLFADQIPYPIKRPDDLPVPDVLHHMNSEDIPTSEALGYDAQSFSLLVSPGERAAQQQLRTFMAEAVLRYRDQRDIPGIAGTSMLSAHLRAGTISIRQVYHHAADIRNQVEAEVLPQVDTFINELIWRDFYHQILFNFPYVEKQDFKPDFAQVAWRSAPEDLVAWQEGRTGYPIVDAAMRQLRQHGWMHNRLRMIVAMFLTKHLLIHWQEGEQFFAEHLVDLDLAQNNGGWQWSASTGTDAQPYFRIFNPIEQSKKFDAQGQFIRQFCPELARVPAAYLHAPWEMPADLQTKLGVQIGRDYPAPIVDHKRARERALEAFKAAKNVSS